MLNFKIINHNFKDWIAAHINLSEHIQIIANEFKINLITIDDDLTTIIQSTLLPNTFVDYNISTSIHIGLNLEQLSNILKNFNNKDEIQVVYKREEPILLLQTNDTIYSLPIIDEEQWIDSPVNFNKIYNSISFLAKFNVDKETFFNKIKSTNNVSDIHLSIINDTFLIDSNQTNKHHGVAYKGNITHPQNVNDCKSTFNNEKLKYLLKGIKKANDLVLQLGMDCPICMSFNINDIKLKYILACKLD